MEDDTYPSPSVVLQGEEVSAALAPQPSPVGSYREALLQSEEGVEMEEADWEAAAQAAVQEAASEVAEEAELQQIVGLVAQPGALSSYEEEALMASTDPLMTAPPPSMVGVTRAEILAWRSLIRSDMTAQCDSVAEMAMFDAPPLSGRLVRVQLENMIAREAWATAWAVSVGVYTLPEAIPYHWAHVYFEALRSKLAARYAKAFPDSAITSSLHDQVLSPRPQTYYSLTTRI